VFQEKLWRVQMKTDKSKTMAGSKKTANKSTFCQIESEQNLVEHTLCEIGRAEGKNKKRNQLFVRYESPIE